MLVALFLLAECVFDNFQSLDEFCTDRRTGLLPAEAVRVLCEGGCHGIHIFCLEKNVIGGR